MFLTAQKVEQLIEKWQQKGFKLYDLPNDIVKRNTAILLENEHNYISETAISDLSTDIADFKKILMPLTRRIMPNLLANEIVGVQPMAGPVSIAYALRFFASVSSPSASGYAVGSEIGYNNMDDSFTGSVPTSAGETWASTNPSPYTSSFFPEAKTTMQSTVVTANTRKMKARYSLESAQDLKNMHGLDIEAELTNMLQYEVGAEIDRELVIDINTLGASQHSDGQYTSSYTITAGDGTWEAQLFRNMYTRFVREAAAIARRTRRGAGNFIIASGNVVTALDSLGTFLLQPLAGANPMEIGPGVAKVGTIENRFAVYRDTFASADYATIGFKGQGTQNSGVIYCPYIPLMMSKAVEPGNFTPVIGMLTRYGIVNQLLNSQDFYSYMPINFAGVNGFGSVI